MLEDVLGRLADAGKTLLISTHDMDFAFRWATRAVVFAGGEIIADDTPEGVFRNAEILKQARLAPPAMLTVFDALRTRGLFGADTPVPRTPDALVRLVQKV